MTATLQSNSNPHHHASTSLRQSLVEDTSKSVEEQQPLNANQYMLQRRRQLLKEASRLPVVKISPSSYPTIDISSFVEAAQSRTLTIDKERAQQQQSVVDQVLQCAVDTGSFHITGHGISVSLLRELDQVSRHFFQQPLDYKKSCIPANDSSHLRGYVPFLSESVPAVYENKPSQMDQREIYGAVYGMDKDDENDRSSSTNADGTNEEPLQSLIDQILPELERVQDALHVILTRALSQLQKVELPDDYLNMVRKNLQSLLRLSHYPSVLDEDSSSDSSTVTTDEDQHLYDHDKLIAHSDWGTLTIMTSQQCSGLQEIRQGQWTNVPEEASGNDILHVVLGDLVHFASNGRFVNNIHRVVQDGGQGRVSLNYFAAQVPVDGSTITPLMPIVSSDPS